MRFGAPRKLAVGILVGTALAIAGCGGGDDAPTSVDAADLERDGEFWNSLSADLKEDLVELGKEQLGEDRPDGAPTIQSYDSDELVSEIDDEYSNESNTDTTIFQTYTTANDELAQQQFDSLAPDLGPQAAP